MSIRIADQSSLEASVRRLQVSEDPIKTMHITRLGSLANRHSRPQQLYRPHDVESLAVALKNNTTIDTVYFNGIGDELGASVMTPFWESFGSLSNLQRVLLQMSSFTPQAVWQLLKHARQMETLILLGPNLEGARAPHWSQMESHPSLRKVKLLNPYIGRGDPFRLNEFLTAMANIPTLEVLEVLEVYKRLRNAPVYFSDYFGMQDLTEATMQALLSAPNLTTLNISVPKSAPRQNSHLPLITRQLSNPNHILQTLEVPIGVITSERGALLAEMLRTNTHLSKLTLDVHRLRRPTRPVLEQGNHDGLMDIAEALKEHNGTLSTLVLKGGESKHFDCNILKALVEMLQANTAMTTFVALLKRGEKFAGELLMFHTMLKFYLRLNEFGRGEFEANNDIPVARWVDKLAEIGSGKQEDFSCLFFFLSLNPSLCG